jgi:mono/diheme cytochrome c family protein
VVDVAALAAELRLTRTAALVLWIVVGFASASHGVAAQAPGRAKAGQALFESACAACHGRTGKGDGPVAAVLTPRPGDHTDGRYMNPLSEEFLFAIIRNGGAAVQRSSKMPPAPKQITDAEVRDLIAFVRSLARNPAYRVR